MSEEVRKYIDKKFENLYTTLRWGTLILITILLGFGTTIGFNTRKSVVNSGNIERHELALKEMVTKQQMERLIEFSTIRKELVMTYFDGEPNREAIEDKIDALWKRLDLVESNVVRDDYGMYFRNAKGR